MHAQRRRRLRKVLLVAGATTLALALMAAGAALGQVLLPRQVVVQQVVEQAVVEHAAVSMPNVLGLTEVDARAAVSDSGHHQAITVTERPAAGDPGTTIEQNPLPGVTLTDETPVELVVSSVVATPDLTGTDQRTAQSAIEALGGAAQFEPVVDADAPLGSVLASVPKAGDPMPQVVRLQIATGGSSRPLTDVRPLATDRCSRQSDLLVNGKAVAVGVRCTPFEGRDAQQTFALSRKVAHLRFTLGMDDRVRDPGARARVTVVADDQVVLTKEVVFGASSEHSLPVKDALRVQVVVTSLTPDADPAVVLGDPALIGLAVDLDQLS